MPAATTIFMFSGQGSHYYQMGRELFEKNATFRRSMLDMDVMVRDLRGESVVGALYSDARTKADPFERILLTHPAIFMVEFALAQALLARGIIPDCTLGASAGAFAAAAIAGSLTAEAALSAVLKQAALIEARCPAGGMIAVLSDLAIQGLEELGARFEIAAVNSASHHVLAAPRDSLEAIEALLKKRAVSFQRLAVGYAFHSRWIEEIAAELAAISRDTVHRRPDIPIVCCAGACTLGSIPQDYFWTVARQPIMFGRTIGNLQATGKRYRYIDVGPAGSLATCLKYALGPSAVAEVRSVLSPFGRDLQSFERLVGGPS